jgi:hypothetical protein
MYTARYEVRLEKRPFSQQEATSELNAWFRFGHEVSARDRKLLEKRYGHNSLAKYFEDSEGLKKTIGPEEDGSKYVDNKGREARVSACVCRLGFDVKVTSKEKMPIEDMLNLDALNQFILFGRTNENNRNDGGQSQ